MTTVATWNIENLFLPGSEYGPPDLESYEAKLAMLAGTIDSLDADVISLQEVGDPAALDDLVARLHGMWEARLSQAPDPRGIRVAVLSRLPVLSSHDIVELPGLLQPPQISDLGEKLERLRRGALATTVAASSGPLTLVACHLKSKLLTFPGGRFSPRSEDERARYAAYAIMQRAVEAATIRDGVNTNLDGAGPSTALILAGDLNDGADAATTQILLGPGGSEIGTAGENRPDRGDGWRLWNLAPLLQPLPDGSAAYTRIYRGRREVIDHLLVTRAVLDRLDRTSVRVVLDSPLPSVADDPTRRRGAIGSDHAPLVAVIP
ncbi:MAG: endonuclease/exonuclease/phosphatase family protein [Candidatus Nanopelagicales bacterium]